MKKWTALVLSWETNAHARCIAVVDFILKREKAVSLASIFKDEKTALWSHWHVQLFPDFSLPASFLPTLFYAGIIALYLPFRPCQAWRSSFNPPLYAPIQTVMWGWSQGKESPLADLESLLKRGFPHQGILLFQHFWAFLVNWPGLVQMCWWWFYLFLGFGWCRRIDYGF